MSWDSKSDRMVVRSSSPAPARSLALFSRACSAGVNPNIDEELAARSCNAWSTGRNSSCKRCTSSRTSVSDFWALSNQASAWPWLSQPTLGISRLYHGEYHHLQAPKPMMFVQNHPHQTTGTSLTHPDQTTFQVHTVWFEVWGSDDPKREANQAPGRINKSSLRDLPETNSSRQKETSSYSNHLFSGANC